VTARVSEAPVTSGAPGLPGRVLLALVAGQVGMHGAMAGLRMAAPLQALREGYDIWAVGLLLALFAAAPVLLALHAGRMADRHGYHRPVRIAIGLTVLGAVFTVGSTALDGAPHFALLCLGAAFAGAGANMGMLATQRTAGQSARDTLERVRIFSWLGIAPSFANVVGPVSAGLLIDLGGFRTAYLFLLALPLVSWWSTRQVPQRPPRPDQAPEGTHGSAWNLLRAPGMKRLLVVNWLLSACWDVHTFAVPVLGHERGFSASTIGFILGTFTLSVSLIRLAIPLIAHRMREVAVVRGAMLGTAAIFVLYPLTHSPWLMALCATLLGVTLGCVQPMIMSTLHRITPDQRHGESLAFRSMAINLSSSVMPLVFGAAGVAVGAAALFWFVGAAVGAGSWAARGLGPVNAVGGPSGSVDRP
jgi:MFS family permease